MRWFKPSFEDFRVCASNSIRASSTSIFAISSYGMEAARKVSGCAGQVLKYGGIFSAKGKAEIKRFDLDLRDKGHTLNPGTTADLTAAVLFAYLVENDLPQLFQSHQVPPADPASVQ
jgi:triphosphoribosyl-dephospho-CoA synthase